VKMEEFDSLQSSLDKGLFELTKLWREIGIDNVTANDRKKTVNFQLKNILDRMIKEENDPNYGST